MNANLSKEDIALFEALHKERELDARTFNKPDYKGIWSGVVDKYKEKAHFVYELLQNADDAQASEAIFQLKRDRVVFRHNGAVHFTITPVNDFSKKGHINAITGVGNSTKNDKDGNTIGKFGVGFKAVFQYTSEPHIYDNNFWFKIENYIVPTALANDYAGRKDGETIFEFPFFSPASAYIEIIDRLKNLDNPILFLRHLKKVIIEFPNEPSIIYEKKILEEYLYDNIKHELLSILNNGRTEKIHMFTQEIEVINEENKKIKQFISVGYFLDSKGNLNDTITGKVFCFFPTAERFKLHCVVHAPFLLVDSRQQLKDSKHNYTLKSKLADLAAIALVYLRDYGTKRGQFLVNENIFNFIPPKDNSYYADDTFRDAYIGIIQEEKLLLGRGNKYILPAGALVCRPISMMHIISDEQLRKLRQEEEIDEEDWDEESYDEYESNEEVEYNFLREETQKLYSQNYIKEILDELEICEYDGRNLASDLTPEFMSEYGFKWAKRLYSHLRNEQVSLWKRVSNSKKGINETPFCLSPILLTSKGTWEPPYLKSGALNVYLPLVSDVDEYNFVAEDYFKDKETKLFLEDLGLKQPDAWDYIHSIILKKHVSNEKLTESELNNNLEIVYDYIRKIENATVRKERMDALSEELLLLDVQGGNHLAKELYDNTDSLLSYFKYQSRKFVGIKKYQRFIDKYSVQEFHSFIRELGVASFPKIIKRHRYSLTYPEEQWLGIKKYTWCSFEDYHIDGFKEKSFATTEESKTFWNWLSECYDIEQYRETTVKYQYYSYYDVQLPTTLVNDLFNKAWIVLPGKKALKPSEVGLEDLEEAGFNIDYKLIKLFGIEKRTKSLKELGASASQIQQNELGKLAASMGLDTPEKLKMALDALEEKKKREASRPQQQSNPKQEEKSDSEESFFSSQRNTNLDEMSSSTDVPQKKTPKNERSMDERVSEITQKLTDEANKRIEEENKRAQVADLERYSKIWFTTLLDLEYSNTSESYGGKNGVRILFEEFRKEPESERIYQLSNPSRNIPIWIEDLGGFSVKFTFFNRDDIVFDFEVANVKDFTLRVKAKTGDVNLIDQIDWTRCSKAVIEVNSPVEIMHRLKNEFEKLPYGDDFNFKEGLANDISFVFGPPGTGKTTRLAQIIKQKMERKDCKILVLTPTNKACDVLTRKLIETSDDYTWLGRFVATGDEMIESKGVLIDRSSNLYNEDKCCIVSTMARLPYDGFTQTGLHSLLKDIEWDFVIVDEASMIPLVQIVYSIYKLKTNFIIAGDPLQIAPIVREQGWVGENIYSMVELDNFENPVTKPIQFEVEKLNTQYRSLPSIGSLYSEYCYDGKLKHNRKSTDARKISTGNIIANQVTFVPFKVEKFDSIYGAKKLQGSNVHVYSSILAVEMCAYLAKSQSEEDIKIGVICPYAPQAQLINKMIEQRTDIPSNVEVSVGTIHGFQGDQCDIIITVFNPPTGIIVAADKIMLNNRKIINVAISRACDYLFVLLPHPDSYGYENLIELNRLCGIANRKCSSVGVYLAELIEKSIFGKKNYIESNTFVTTHQVANVYTSPSSLYEVRIDENAVDIQTTGVNYQTQVVASTEETKIPIMQEPAPSVELEEVKPAADSQLVSESTGIKVKIADDCFTEFSDPLQYFDYFSKLNLDLRDSLEIMVSDCTYTSLFALVQIVGSPERANLCGWYKVDEDDIRSIKDISQKHELTKALYPQLFLALRHHTLPIKGIGSSPIKNLEFEEFKDALEAHIMRMQDKAKQKERINYTPEVKKKSKRPRIVKDTRPYGSSFTHTKKDEGKLYDRFEYGLSDW